MKSSTEIIEFLKKVDSYRIIHRSSICEDHCVPNCVPVSVPFEHKKSLPLQEQQGL